MQTTLAIIKPNAIADNNIGRICTIFEQHNLAIVGATMTMLNQNQVREFYQVHNKQVFFEELVQFMTSGPVMALALHGENVITRVRELVGVTDPCLAKNGTIRNMFATSIEANAIHASNAIDTAMVEVAFFFNNNQIYLRKPKI